VLSNSKHVRFWRFSTEIDVRFHMGGEQTSKRRVVTSAVGPKRSAGTSQCLRNRLATSRGAAQALAFRANCSPSCAAPAPKWIPGLACLSIGSCSLTGVARYSIGSNDPGLPGIGRACIKLCGLRSRMQLFFRLCDRARNAGFRSASTETCRPVCPPTAGHLAVSRKSPISKECVGGGRSHHRTRLCISIPC
jgi:hypothetical protein